MTPARDFLSLPKQIKTTHQNKEQHIWICSVCFYIINMFKKSGREQNYVGNVN